MSPIAYALVAAVEHCIFNFIYYIYPFLLFPSLHSRHGANSINKLRGKPQARGNVFGESVTFWLLLLRVFPLASSAFKQSLHWISCEPLNDIVPSSFLQHHIGPASATAATSDGQLAQNSSASVAPGVHQVSFCRPNWAQAEIE